ncbi:unnamed protein product [Pylaiella littoralis]
MWQTKTTFTAAVFLGTAVVLAYVVGVFVGQQNHVHPGSTQLDRFERKLTTLQAHAKDDNTSLEVQPTPDEYSGVIVKSVFSSKMRMIIPVGIEGTGHHAVHTAISEMCKLDTVLCPGACDVNTALFWDMGAAKDESQYKHGLDKLQDAMDALAMTADGLDNDEICLTVPGKCSVRMMSFPAHEGPDKALQYIDLKIFAREAERAGIDLRFIYLDRSATNVLISTTQHRTFGGTFSHEARILITNAAVIDSALREVDSGFVSCFSFDGRSDSRQAARVAEDVMPTPDAATMFSHLLLEYATDHSPPSTNLSVVDDQEGWELMSNRLQEKFDLIQHDHCYGAQVDHRQL